MADQDLIQQSSLLPGIKLWVDHAIIGNDCDGCGECAKLSLKAVLVEEYARGNVKKENISLILNIEELAKTSKMEAIV